uniref:protein disulfide-isomerase n=1 Tax=Araucaria cunninghamii TaxID=56994 RepID=A0A0D6R390_ARACU
MEIWFTRRIAMISIALLLLLFLNRAIATQQDEDDDDLEALDELDEVDSNDDEKFSEAEAVSRAQRIVADLNNDNAERVLNSHEYVLLLGYASWCQRSAELMPEFASAATKLKEMGSPVLLAKLDADRHTRVASKYDIKGFPTLLFFVNGTWQSYTGGFSGDEIVTWVRKKTGVPTVKLSSISEAENFLKRNPTLVVGFFKEFEGSAYEEFVKAAKDDNEVQFVEVNNLDVAAFFSLEINHLPHALGLIKSEPEKFVVFEGEFQKENLIQFIELNKYPLVTRVTARNSVKVLSNPIKLQIYIFAEPDDHESVLPLFQAAAKKYKSKIFFLLIDSTDDSLAKPLLTLFGLEATKPIVTAFDNREGSKYLFESDITPETLEDFCSKLVTGNLVPYYKSEPIPAENKGDVRVVVGKTFGDIVLKSSEDVLLEVTTPWSMKSKGVSKLTEKVAKHFKGVPSLVIARIDASVNEHPDLQVTAYPSFLFYRADKKEAPIKVSTKFNLKDLIEFIKENVGLPLTEVKKHEEHKEQLDSEQKDEL